MPSLRYRNAYISIFHIPDKSGNSSCIAYVEIRHKLEGSPSARLVLNGPFSDAHPAREHAFAMEKERIDDWLASKGKSAPSGQIATEAGGDLPAVSTGLGVGSHRWHLPVLCRGGLPERKS